MFSSQRNGKVSTKFQCNLEMFPYRNREEKDWLIASAQNKVNSTIDTWLSKTFQESVLCEMLKSSPNLLELTDPYSGYSAIHWAAKVELLSSFILKQSLQHDNDSLIINLLKSHHHSECEVNRQSHGGYTPLHIAAINKSQKVSASNIYRYSILLFRPLPY